jgi:hypothetical protein
LGKLRCSEEDQALLESMVVTGIKEVPKGIEIRYRELEYLLLRLAWLLIEVWEIQYDRLKVVKSLPNKN